MKDATIDSKTAPAAAHGPAGHRRLYLLRHGATEANVCKPYVLQGQRTNTSLIETGRQQAQAAQRALANAPIEHFYASPLRRAFETAQIIAEPHGQTVHSVPELTECDVGRWEGLSWEAIRQQDPECFRSFEGDPGCVPYAGGESFQQVQLRAVPAIERLVRDNARGDLLVVTHNVVARVYVAHLTGLPIAKARTVRLDNCGITVVLVGGSIPKLLTLNSVFHLEGLLID